MFEELEMNDLEKARDVYQAGLRTIPHKTFTFAKMWILAAQLGIRRKNLDGARRLFGQALGICPKEKIFQKYIEIEFYMSNIDRCRILYAKFIEYRPNNCE